MSQNNTIKNELNFSSIETRVIPSSWYKHITIEKKHKNKNGLITYPDLLAISVLADIVYWYQNITIVDEKTGQTILTKKFKDDKLQRNYKQIAEFFGCSYEQAKTAIRKLEKEKLITVEFRNIKTDLTTLSNVMFVEPIVKNIIAINS